MKRILFTIFIFPLVTYSSTAQVYEYPPDLTFEMYRTTGSLRKEESPFFRDQSFYQTGVVERMDVNQVRTRPDGNAFQPEWINYSYNSQPLNRYDRLILKLIFKTRTGKIVSSTNLSVKSPDTEVKEHNPSQGEFLLITNDRVRESTINFTIDFGQGSLKGNLKFNWRGLERSTVRYMTQNGNLEELRPGWSIQLKTDRNYLDLNDYSILNKFKPLYFLIQGSRYFLRLGTYQEKALADRDSFAISIMKNEQLEFIPEKIVAEKGGTVQTYNSPVFYSKMDLPTQPTGTLPPEPNRLARANTSSAIKEPSAGSSIIYEGDLRAKGPINYDKVKVFSPPYGYSVQLVALMNIPESAKFSELQVPLYVLQTDRYYKVIAGPYISNAVAEEALEYLKNAGYTEAFLIEKQQELINYWKLNQDPINYAAPASYDNTAREVYLVQYGDTLTGIARKYGLTVAQLKKINKLTSDEIDVGQVLKVN